MIDPVAKAKELEEKAKIRNAERVQAAKTERATQWRNCQENAPEIANLLTLLNGTFGKPAAVKVELIETKQVILESGKFDPPKDLTVPKYSQQYSQNRWKK